MSDVTADYFEGVERRSGKDTPFSRTQEGGVAYTTPTHTVSQPLTSNYLKWRYPPTPFP